MRIRSGNGPITSPVGLRLPRRGNPIVPAIQKSFPPPGQIPHPPPGPSKPPDDRSHQLDSISRTPPPPWLEPGKGVLVPAGGELIIEGECPVLEDHPRAGIARKVGVRGRCEDCPVLRKGAPAGIDVLAYYLPFHFYLKDWGIYVRSSGILQVSSHLASTRHKRESSDLTNLAYGLLLHHERFHFLTEMACSRAELVLAVPLYARYYNDGYAVACEEALANAYAFRTAVRGQPEVISKKVKRWMKAQGPGYRNFTRCVTPSAFTDRLRLVTRRMLSVASPSLSVDTTGIVIRSAGVGPVHASGVPVIRPTEFLYDGLARSAAPVRIVLDVPCVGVLKPFPKYAGVRVKVHCNDHPPPHIHVEIPPGTPITRVSWPALRPLEGDPALSRSQRKSLEKYISKYGGQLEEKVRQVYQFAN
jgi:hypothetical protein